jgi:hypothetical protein
MLPALTLPAGASRRAGADRQAGLPEVMHVLDDHDDSRDNQEDRRSGQELYCDFPERDARDGERDEERDHVSSSPDRGGAAIEARAGVVPFPPERVRCRATTGPYLDSEFRCLARSMGQHRPCFLLMQLTYGAGLAPPRVASSVRSPRSSFRLPSGRQGFRQLSGLTFR